MYYSFKTEKKIKIIGVIVGIIVSIYYLDIFLNDLSFYNFFEVAFRGFILGFIPSTAIIDILFIISFKFIEKWKHSNTNKIGLISGITGSVLAIIYFTPVTLNGVGELFYKIGSIIVIAGIAYFIFSSFKAFMIFAFSIVLTIFFSTYFSYMIGIAVFFISIFGLVYFWDRYEKIIDLFLEKYINKKGV